METILRYLFVLQCTVLPMRNSSSSSGLCIFYTFAEACRNTYKPFVYTTEHGLCTTHYSKIDNSKTQWNVIRFHVENKHQLSLNDNQNEGDAPIVYRQCFWKSSKFINRIKEELYKVDSSLVFISMYI